MNKKAIFTLFFFLLLMLVVFALSASAYSDDEYYYNEVEYEESEETGIGTYILISLGVGLVVALVSVLIMRGQLKNVRMQRSAASYVLSGSYKLNVSRDHFLYSTVTKTARPKNNSNGKRG